MRTLWFFVFLLPFIAQSQKRDTLFFAKGQYMIGEVKKMDKGVVSYETDYSDKDFQIDWDRVISFETTNLFVISTKNGQRFKGNISTLSNGKIEIKTLDGKQWNFDFEDIVFLNSYKKRFWNQLRASFDLGVNLTKANNYSQYTFNADLGYIAKKWSFNGNYSDLSSTQDDTEPTERSSSQLALKYYLPRDFFLSIGTSTLSNTEQELHFRLNSSLGAGVFIVHTNRTYLGIQIGGNSNREQFFGEDVQYSWEGYSALGVNVFDLGDLNLQSSVVLYYGRKEGIRWRTDYNLNVKYDLPLDFYINLNFVLNYDSQPPEDASKTDYQISSGFGWSFN